MTTTKTTKPTTKRRRSPPKAEVPDEKAVNMVMGMVERLGVPTFILLAACYFGYKDVAVPLVQKTTQALEDIGKTNQLLEEHQKENDREDGERVALLKTSLEAIDRKLELVIERLRGFVNGNPPQDQ